MYGHHQLGTTSNENIDINMAKIEFGNDKAQPISDTVQTEAGTSAKSRSNGNFSGTSSYKVGQMLTCFSCILFIVLLQVVDCRHHDLNNVINCSLLVRVVGVSS